MRVLMLGWEYPPRISGGLGTACRGIVRGLVERGVEVLLVLPRASGGGRASTRGQAGAIGARPARAPLVREIALESTLSPYLDERAHAARGGGYGPGLHEAVALYAERAVRALRHERVDVVHAHDWMTFPAGLALRDALDRPLVCHVHACEHDRAAAYPDPRIVAVECRALAQCERVVGVSRATAAVLRARYGADEAKLRVVHNGVEPPQRAETRRRPPPRRGGPIVLFLGRLTAQKDPRAFLDAAALVLREEPRARFVVAGRGELGPALAAQAEALGIARSVRFPGFLAGAAAGRMLRRADVYVMPSASEPFGLAPLEAAVRGTPAIVSAASGVTEVLASALRSPRDPAALARRILLLLRRPALAVALARGARREAARLTWSRAARSLHAIYEEVAA